MPFEVEALIAHAPNGSFIRGRVPRRDLNPDDVLITIHYAGICHSDVHQAKGEWPMKHVFPMVPGHEIVGLITAVGRNVGKTELGIGQKVGVGCIVDSCRSCESCKQGFEQYCHGGAYCGQSDVKLGGMIGTYNAHLPKDYVKKCNYPDDKTYGGYSQQIVVDKKYVCKIPDAIPFEYAAPLLCAGITMFSPLVYYGAREAGSKFNVAIAGLGGLGDVGAKISKAMGNTVTVISRSEKKREHVEKELGVKYIASGSTEGELTAMVQKYGGSFDLIISTISSKFDINKYIDLLKNDGTICLVGVPSESLELEAGSVIFGRKKLVGSLIGGIKETQEMLDFCAKHKIYSEVEQISASEVNRAYKELADFSAAKSRFVIKIKESLTSDRSWTVDMEPVKHYPKHIVHPKASIVGYDNVAGKAWDPATNKFQ